MKKLISFRKFILIIGIAFTLILATIQLIFGKGDSYISNVILMVVCPLFLFAFFIGVVILDSWLRSCTF